MKFGLNLFRLRPEVTLDVARAAERLGFESLWIPDHLVFPTEIQSRYPYSPDGTSPVLPGTRLMDPFAVLAYLAAATSAVRLGTAVYILPLRHPLLTARAAASVDVLSGGRLSLGVGIGWMAEEFLAAGQGFRDRADRTRECVAVLRALWTEREPQFHGRFFDLGPLRFEPKPVQQPHPPILFGGETEKALRRAAELGNGWMGMIQSPEAVARKVRRLKELRDAAGRAGHPFEITVAAGASVEPDDVARYEDAGVHRLQVWPWSPGTEVEDLARCAQKLRLRQLQPPRRRSASSP